jgi:hypothetical protein
LLDLLPAFEVGQHAGLPLYFEQGRPANSFGDLASFVEPLPQIDHRPICGAVEALVKERLRRILPPPNSEIIGAVGAGSKPVR